MHEISFLKFVIDKRYAGKIRMDLKKCCAVENGLRDSVRQPMRIFSDAPKIAKLIPVHKAKAKNDFFNNRLILLPPLSKILEKIMHKRTSFYFETNEILYKNQYGFSTIDAITKFVTDTVMAVFLDQSKAFDTIYPNILLKNWNCLDLEGNAWIDSEVILHTGSNSYTIEA